MSDLFPKCTVHTMPQRSPEWFDIRADKMTASTAGSWIASDSKAKTVVKSREREISRLIASREGFRSSDSFQIDMEAKPPKNSTLRAIYYGILMEPEALSLLSLYQGLDLEEVGFCEHESGIAGSSPDSVINGESGVVETKVTIDPELQIYRLTKGEIPPEYVNQVHFQMATTGAEYCWFQSYFFDPESNGSKTLPPLQIKVERDEYTDKIEAGINRFAADFEKAWGIWEKTNH